MRAAETRKAGEVRHAGTLDLLNTSLSLSLSHIPIAYTSSLTHTTQSRTFSSITMQLRVKVVRIGEKEAKHV